MRGGPGGGGRRAGRRGAGRLELVVVMVKLLLGRRLRLVPPHGGAHAVLQGCRHCRSLEQWVVPARRRVANQAAVQGGHRAGKARARGGGGPGRPAAAPVRVLLRGRGGRGRGHPLVGVESRLRVEERREGGVACGRGERARELAGPRKTSWRANRRHPLPSLLTWCTAGGPMPSGSSVPASASGQDSDWGWVEGGVPVSASARRGRERERQPRPPQTVATPRMRRRQATPGRGPAQGAQRTLPARHKPSTCSLRPSHSPISAWPCPPTACARRRRRRPRSPRARRGRRGRRAAPRPCGR